MKNVSKTTIVRTIALIVSIANYVLTVKGKNPIPFSETAVYETVSTIFLWGSSIAAWWKNNSFTYEAITADKLMKDMKKVHKN